MKPILKQIVVPAGSAMLGGLAVIVALKISPSLQSKIAGERPIRPSAESLYDDFFSPQNPFEQMRKIREQLEMHHQNPSDPFQSWFSDSIAAGAISEISKREDDNSVYYDIQVEDVNSASIDTKVENGYLTITGTTEKTGGSRESKENDGFSAQSFSKSTFNKTFPLPEHVDHNKMQMTYEKDKIVLKFPKIKA